MVKTKEQVAAKMQERVSTAGKYMRQGMESGPDPIDILLKNPEQYGQKLAAGVAESVRRGKYTAGLKTAKNRNAYKGSINRAAAHYEERTADMVANSMESYEWRAACIESAKKATEAMPTTTRDQRIARAAAYSKAMGECCDRQKGLKA